jgi:DNA polymerase-3 subunit chi
MRVDFYILQGEANREMTACRLCEKAYHQDLAIYLHARSPEHARQIDDLLWTFNDRAFIPHQLIDAPVDPQAPRSAVIGWPGAEAEHPPRGVLINLADEVPDDVERFERVAEIVNQNEQIKQLGRRRFAYYREQGCELHHHEI